MTISKTVLAEIQAERDYQDAKWGGPEHDKQHGFWDWSNYITKFHGRAVEAMMEFFNARHRGEPLHVEGIRRKVRRQLIKVAALCIAALEHAPDLQHRGGDGDEQQ